MTTPLRPLPSFDSRPDLPIALVVGAGGLGMVIAQRLGQNQRVILASLNSAELNRGQARLHEAGVISAVFACDLGDSESVGDLAASVSRWGPLQTLVHVAAVTPATAGWHDIINVNLAGAARIEGAFRPLMAPGGVAVFISSAGARRKAPAREIVDVLDNPVDNVPERLIKVLADAPHPREAYALAKWALNRLVRRRAPLWGTAGARILSVSPGIIDTEMGAAANQGEAALTKESMRSKLPLGRDGTMAEVADAVEFLISPRARYITGTDLLIDGGLSAALQFPVD